MQRKLALSDWLKNVVLSNVSDDIKRAENLENNDSPVNKVYTYLTGNQVEEACQAAQSIGILSIIVIIFFFIVTYFFMIFFFFLY